MSSPHQPMDALRYRVILLENGLAVLQCSTSGLAWFDCCMPDHRDFVTEIAAKRQALAGLPPHTGEVIWPKPTNPVAP